MGKASLSEKYPKWAVEAYGNYDLYRWWDMKRRRGKTLLAIGAVTFPFAFLLFVGLALSVDKDPPFLNQIAFAFLILAVVFTLTGAILFGTGFKLMDVGSEETDRFEQDLARLGDELGLFIGATGKGIASRMAHDVLVWNAVWIRIFELAKNEHEALNRRGLMHEKYLLFLKFNLVQPPPTSRSSPDHLPLKPIFDAAEPKAAETLRFALSRLERQQQGLPI